MLDIPKKNLQIPWIGYLYDFQHKYYPQYFFKKEILKCDIEFETICLTQKENIIITASQTVIEAIKFFQITHPPHIILRFHTVLVLMKSHPDISEDLRKKYNLSKDYFIVSNQFFYA